MGGSKPIRSQGGDGAVEKLKAEFVEHDPGYIDGAEDRFLSLA